MYTKMGKKSLMEKMKLKGQQLKKIVTQNNHKPLRDDSYEVNNGMITTTKKSSKFFHVNYHTLE